MDPSAPPVPTKPSLASLEDDCERPSCEGMISMLKAARERSQQSSVATLQSSTPQQSQQMPSLCPPTSPELGRASWTLLHTMAAWYPDKPTKKERDHMTMFFGALARFYPCTYCAQDFEESLKKHPVKTSSRKSLCVWLCEQHNLVNKKLGKPLFDCKISNLDERWRKSSKTNCQSGRE